MKADEQSVKAANAAAEKADAKVQADLSASSGLNITA